MCITIIPMLFLLLHIRVEPAERRAASCLAGAAGLHAADCLEQHRQRAPPPRLFCAQAALAPLEHINQHQQRNAAMADKRGARSEHAYYKQQHGGHSEYGGQHGGQHGSSYHHSSSTGSTAATTGATTGASTGAPRRTTTQAAPPPTQLAYGRAARHAVTSLGLGCARVLPTLELFHRHVPRPEQVLGSATGAQPSRHRSREGIRRRAPRCRAAPCAAGALRAGADAPP
jgi:hypothetical protein